jgi:hypothetical protein
MYFLRVLRATTGEVRDVLRASTPTHARLLFEHHQNQTQIATFGGALFWTSTQLLTVSSSFQNPISTPARILDVVMEIYAITVIATLAGALGAFLVKRGGRIRPRRQSSRALNLSSADSQAARSAPSGAARPLIGGERRPNGHDALAAYFNRGR